MPLASAAAEWGRLEDLVPWERNPRRIDDDAVGRAVESIRRFGFCAPIVGWRSRGRIVAGHARVLAMRRILAEEPGYVVDGAAAPGLVPVRWREFANEHEAEAYGLRDNRPIGEWDEVALAEIVTSIGDAGLLEVAGWSAGEVDNMIAPPERETWGGADCSQRRNVVELMIACQDSEAVETALARVGHRAASRGEALATICREWLASAP